MINSGLQIELLHELRTVRFWLASAEDVRLSRKRGLNLRWIGDSGCLKVWVDVASVLWC